MSFMYVEGPPRDMLSQHTQEGSELLEGAQVSSIMIGDVELWEWLSCTNVVPTKLLHHQSPSHLKKMKRLQEREREREREREMKSIGISSIEKMGEKMEEWPYSAKWMPLSPDVKEKKVAQEINARANTQTLSRNTTHFVYWFHAWSNLLLVLMTLIFCENSWP